LEKKNSLCIVSIRQKFNKQFTVMINYGILTMRHW